MTESLELADIIRAHGSAYRQRFATVHSPTQERVLQDLLRCRTAALGGHVQTCDHCGHTQIAYNSCRNRHCPKCQGAARAAWMAAREAELLPVPYFHVVFTLPECVGPLALQNKAVVYGHLFQAAAQTLLEVAANPRHLGARIGFLGVLHTWGQNLMHHPHIHFIVPTGGLNADGSEWIPGRDRFFLPVRILSRVFRGKFIHRLKQAFQQDRLGFHGQLAELAQPATFEQFLDQAVSQEWVVYAKRPFGGPEQVLKYLARYTHRVAISNSRLSDMDDDQVVFRYKDYADGHRQKTMTLEATEFLRRFLLHVLPSGFMRIRHFGFQANRCRQANLERCRRLLGVCPSSEPASTCPHASAAEPEPEKPTADTSGNRCRICGQGTLVVTEQLPKATGKTEPGPNHVEPSPEPLEPTYCNSS